jgi:predicted nucleotidyltransferase
MKACCTARAISRAGSPSCLLAEDRRPWRPRSIAAAVRAIVKPITSRNRSSATSLPADFPRRELILGLARRLAAHSAVERVWLFGSRARGDNFERSDIDLAIEAPGMDRYDWLKIALDFGDEAPTLLSIDLIRLEEAPEHLRQDIREEGILLYERAHAQAPV